MIDVKRYIRGLSALKNSIAEVVDARISRWLYYWYARYVKRWPRRVILFYPENPNAMHLIDKLCNMLGYRITNDPNEKADIHYNFEDTTIRVDDETTTRLKKQHEFVNANCADISKAHVEKVFQEVYDYGMAIDPRVHNGICVKKSNINGVHDGRVIQCPCEPEDGYIYQKLVNNRVNDTTVMDIRPLIIGNSIAGVKYRLKYMNKRFGSIYDITVKSAEDAFQPGEAEKLLEFSRRIGLDFGEIDMLRDIDDGRLYIVDVNNTPYDSPIGFAITRKEYREFAYNAAKLFESAFLLAKRDVRIPSYALMHVVLDGLQTPFT